MLLEVNMNLKQCRLLTRKKQEGTSVVLVMSIFWYAYRFYRYNVCENSVNCTIICIHFEVFYVYLKSIQFNSLVCTRFLKEANMELAVL